MIFGGGLLTGQTIDVQGRAIDAAAADVHESAS